MSKKKKIIISSICAGVILLGTILTIILLNIKRFSSYTDSVITYNDHTYMTKVDTSAYHSNIDAKIYENATQIIEDNSGKAGLYSYKQGKTLIEPSYDNIEAIEGKTDGGNTYFLLKDNDRPNEIKIVDKYGEDIKVTAYDKTSNKAYTFVKEKSIISKEKRGKITTKTGDFEKKKTYISSASLDSEYIGENYHYEVWEFETEDGEEFKNIYDLNKNRELVQSMGIETGLTLENTTLWLMVMENGDIRFIEEVQNMNGSEHKSETLAIYDQNYNLKNKVNLGMTSTWTTVPVGDKFLLQTKEYGSESDYTYRVSGNDGIEYYKLTTYTIDLKTGKLKTKKFNYILNVDSSKHSILNQNTTILDVQKIKDKQVADTTTYLLINNRLQTKEIDYSIESLTKISEDRFIAKTTSTAQNNYVLINNKFEPICEFRGIDSYFTTSESVIVTRDQKSYVCNLDGLILKTYDKSDIIDIHHETYYMIKEESVVGGKNKTEYYLERLGIRNSVPISSHTAGDAMYYSNGNEYPEVKLCYENEALSLVILVSEVSSNNYTYKFCNFDGKVLQTVTDMLTPNRTFSTPLLGYSDDYVMVTFDSMKFILDR